MGIWLTAIILGIVEGLTEFLPVSSTGHLILATELLGYDPARWAIFNIAIQPGAILAIVVLYRKLFWEMFTGFFRRDPAAIAFVRNLRSDARRVGNECARPGRSRWSPYH